MGDPHIYVEIKDESDETFCLVDRCTFVSHGSREFLEKLFGAHARTGTNCQFHFADFLVDLFQEVDDEIDQAMLVHALSMEVGDEKADVVVL